jgi:putative acetyltransferase
MAALVTYRIAQTPEDFDTGKQLFEAYAGSLEIDLSFQNFSEELDTIDQQYREPAGGLLLAFFNELPVGCAGVRKLDEETAELKRMYVRDEYRGHKIGVSLLQRALALGAALDYKKLRLDTLEGMTNARKLYSSFGFYEIPSYRFNPHPGAIYMEKDLQNQPI